MDPRAWVGVNMGRSLSTPGAYRIYIPDTGRVLLTSEVYFWEQVELVPFAASERALRQGGSRRARGCTRRRRATPGGASAAQRAGVGQRPRRPRARSLPRRGELVASRLGAFSGPYARPDGISAFLRARGVESDQ
eukprot:4686019-Prymnesium_polylepis.1